MKRHVNVFLVFGLILVFQSCFVAKEYSRPEIEINEHYKGFDAKDSVSLALMPWEQFFEDQKLKELISAALKNNYDFKSAFQNVKIAESFYYRGKARLFPTIGVDASVTSSDFSQNSATGQQFSNLGGQSGNNVPNRIEQYDLTLSSSWEADIWGRLTSIKRSEYASFVASEASYRTVQTRLIADVAILYYQLIRLNTQLELINATLSTREKSLETIKFLKASGQTTEVAVKQNESQLILAKILKVGIEEQILLTKNMLWMLTTKSFEKNISKTFDSLNIENNLDVGFPIQLLRNRPDLQAAEAQLISAFQLTQAKRAEFYPRITLSAAVGFQSLELKNWLDTNSLYNNLLAGLTQPIFNRRALKTQLEVQNARKEQALLSFKSNILQAEREVSDLLISYDAARNRYHLQSNQLEVLEDAVNFSNKLLANGYANYLEVLRATDEMLSVELERINTHYAVKKTEIELYRALGGGWTKE